MATRTSRREFLSTGFLRREPAAMRPPGAVREDFAGLCSRCGDCAAACPEDIIAPDNDGLPLMRLERAECTFCGDCARACGTGALDIARLANWPWRAKITASCLSLNGISCRTCQDACELNAIRFRLQTGGRAQPVLDSETCTGCGACASTCPVGAVAFERAEPQTLEAAE